MDENDADQEFLDADQDKQLEIIEPEINPVIPGFSGNSLSYQEERKGRSRYR
jgi:hypothetical protein